MSDAQSIPSAEEWRDIQGYPGYQVSDRGRVRSSRRTRRRGRIHLTGHWWLLLPQTRSAGYYGILLPCEGRFRHFAVHRLVLEAFVGRCPLGMECCHQDGNPKNNCLQNLRWDTRRNNAADRIRHGTQVRGSKQGHSRFTEDQVLQMRRLHANGVSFPEIGRRFVTTPQEAWRICKGKGWKHVTLETSA